MIAVDRTELSSHFVFAGSGNGGGWRKLRWHLASFVPHGILMTILSHDVVLWTMESLRLSALLTWSPVRRLLPRGVYQFILLPRGGLTFPPIFFTATWMTVESTPLTPRSMKHVL
jgi:hypothetical protein